MYIEKKVLESTMEQEVNEATAKLKGMLGIGVAMVASPPTTVVEQPPSIPSSRNATTTATTTTTTKKPMKSTTTAMVVAPEGENAAQTDNAAAVTVESKATTSTTSRKKPRNRGKKKPEGGTKTPPPKQPQSTEKVLEGKNVTGQKKGKKQPSKKKGVITENYAWSAFQSSPDASKLPIPEFASPVREKSTILSVVESPARTGTLSSLPVVNMTTMESDKTTRKSESNVELGSMNLDKIQLHDAAVTEIEDSKQAQENDNTPQQTNPSAKESASAEEVGAKAGGINLAALAAKPPPVALHPDSNIIPNSLSSPSLPPTNLVESSHSAGIYPSHMSHLHLPPQSSVLPQQYRQPHFAPMPHYPPPPPPGYMTIQVQVPPLLMPGRLMVVQSPAGYPLQVQVPEGIPPGMIIPVHVPAGPPLHMMPPPPQGGSGGGGYYTPAPPPPL